MLAHLRTPAKLDLVGVNSDGVVFALDATSGVALWSTARRPMDSKRFVSGSAAVFLLRSRSGLDDVIRMSGVDVTSIEGTNGRELWRTTLPAAASSGMVINDKGSRILLVDNSGPRLFLLDALTGNLLSQVKLPHRVVGAPVAETFRYYHLLHHTYQGDERLDTDLPTELEGRMLQRPLTTSYLTER